MTALPALIAAAFTMQNVPDTPANKWLYDTAAEFRHCGLWPNAILTHGARPLTTYEFAVSVHANTLQMPNLIKARIDSIHKGKPNTYHTPGTAFFDDLERMTVHFGKELKSMGVTGSHMSQLTRALTDSRSLAAQLRALDPKSTLSPAKRVLPDIPENHWLYNSLETLQKRGGLVTDVFHSHMRVPTRGMIVRELMVSIPHNQKLATYQEEHIRLKGDALLDDETTAFFKQAVLYFSTEIRELGGNVAAIYRQAEDLEKRTTTLRQIIAGNAPLFTDVPEDHWAAKAILELRSKGLIVGYPDERFKGG